MWKLKVLLQRFLAMIPGGQRVNYLLQTLKGAHSSEETAKRITAYAKTIRFINDCFPLEGSTVVEVGTGWDALSALLFYLMGAEAVYTYDHYPHVRFRLVWRVVQQMRQQIPALHSITSVPAPLLHERLERLEGARQLQQLFAAARITYIAPADASRTGLPDQSVDLFYSYAVLQHVPEQLVEKLVKECGRILRKHGQAFHMIGLIDHYWSASNSLSKVNFLRYPEWLWTLFAKNKIHYQNRLREKQYLDLFRSCGAVPVWKRNHTDPAEVEVVKRMKVDRQFAGMTPEELAVDQLEILLSYSEAQPD